MTVDSKLAKPKRRNKNRHYRVTLKPSVRKLIGFLRNSWAVLGAVERGQRINKLVSIGCSKRGLGKDLEVPESSVRRDAKIAELPESDRNAIDSGQSAKKILIAKKTTALQKEMRERIDEDARTGALSDEIASIILRFCRTGYRLRKQPIIKATLSTFLDNVGSHLRKFEQSDLRAPKAAKKLEPRELFRKTRPPAGNNTPAVAYQAEWLAEALWLIAPESPIRSRALIKAMKRANELLPRRTIPEIIQDAHVKAELRIIELTHRPPRKNYPGGARAFIQRQGPTSPSEHPNGSRKRDSKP